MISNNINLAIDYLKNDGIIGLPTETVYGLAGNAFSEKSIKKIFEVKKRPSFNPLIVHIKCQKELSKIAIEVPEKAKQLADAFWPGPLTLILKKQSTISDLITANQDTVAVRIPNHPIALELLNQLEFPLVAPSANPFTRISPTKAVHVEHYFKNEVDMVLDGGSCTAGIESTIVGFDDDKVVIYRLGALAVDEIEKVVGKVHFHSKKDEKTITPGMHLKHYAPSTNFILTHDVLETLTLFSGQKIGLLLFKATIENMNLNQQYVLSEKGSLEEAASQLFEALHQLDNENFDVIIAEYFPNYGLGLAINDRLERASRK
ncbi:L-threonylcarbamoyladenylate synthase [Flavobacterium sp.]|uniref:L-threonylcarbamoyladenylate synthase n=1 Tax=Flavobacterium sp. TaxID=239 RepID=UPI002B4B7A7C|nr:L-threonylcarbamoyladenylate synthase [Flavobacterium sp.]HLP65196.1 L-threonylcarbamoyladenylate synthase [Flavobacterium sp.]